MEPEIQRKIEETVIEVLKTADIDEMTEFKVRNMAAEKLRIDLSGPELKQFVRNVVETFLLSTEEERVKSAAADEGELKEIEEEEEDDRKPSIAAKEFDDDGDLIICRISNKRRVTVQDFRGKTLVSIREYYKRDGKELPSSKVLYYFNTKKTFACCILSTGISLTAEQWSAFRNNVPAIEEAIRKMESRLR
ncbi:hypothetical protein HHK36_027502 [Tetracentron sinense]|uniref:DEK-C domain-containing protein n=1 Tax=Tetracentron sinense TaxID=13715 RepID=A0A835D143_TETSI|nr:hypothetical protein HHK36_027502 [Tetracentron sinense]